LDFSGAFIGVKIMLHTCYVGNRKRKEDRSGVKVKVLRTGPVYAILPLLVMNRYCR
jgi:hypothetical protein